MKIGMRSESLVEYLVSAVGAFPTPLFDTFQAMVRARVIMIGTRLGVFEALKDKPAAAREVAEQIGTEPRATEKLLNGLVGAGYLHFDGQRYQLTRVVRKWLLRDSPQSLHDNMIHRFLEWDVLASFEDFVRTGKPLNVHEGMLPEQWDVYQRGMRSLASLSAKEVARRAPVPAAARRMLDIGGSHGYYSVALCRRHPELHSTILDLPDAVRFAQPILARENMGDRVVYRADNALSADLGENCWDFVFTSQLLHHFDEETNQHLVRRIARALAPGGVFAVLEVLRPSSPNAAGQLGALLDLFFAVTSTSGSWSAKELADWQSLAGLTPKKPIRLLTMPGAAIQAAVKS